MHASTLRHRLRKQYGHYADAQHPAPNLPHPNERYVRNKSAIHKINPTAPTLPHTSPTTTFVYRPCAHRPMPIPASQHPSILLSQNPLIPSSQQPNSNHAPPTVPTANNPHLTILLSCHPTNPHLTVLPSRHPTTPPPFTHHPKRPSSPARRAWWPLRTSAPATYQ